MKTDPQGVEQRVLITIAHALEQTNHQPLRQIELRWESGTVVLIGLTPTYFLKQLAQTVAMEVTGVGRIDNRLQVCCGVIQQR